MNKTVLMDPLLNYFECWLMDDGKVGYHNSWVTDIRISGENVEELVRGGRCLWKIENEVFNDVNGILVTEV